MVIPGGWARGGGPVGASVWPGGSVTGSRVHRCGCRLGTGAAVSAAAGAAGISIFLLGMSASACGVCAVPAAALAAGTGCRPRRSPGRSGSADGWVLARLMPRGWSSAIRCRALEARHPRTPGSWRSGQLEPWPGHGQPPDPQPAGGQPAGRSPAAAVRTGARTSPPWLPRGGTGARRSAARTPRTRARTGRSARPLACHGSARARYSPVFRRTGPSRSAPPMPPVSSCSARNRPGTHGQTGWTACPRACSPARHHGAPARRRAQHPAPRPPAR